MNLYTFTYQDSCLLNQEALDTAIKAHVDAEAFFQKWKPGYTYFVDTILTESAIGRVTYTIYVEGEYEEATFVEDIEAFAKALPTKRLSNPNNI